MNKFTKITSNNHYDNDPRCLQNNVYFDIAYFLSKHRKEGLRQLTKDSFEIKSNDNGKEYTELKYNEATKKSQGDDYNEINDNPIILAQPGKRSCPVASLRLYLSKLTPIKDFFQQPNPCFKKVGQDKWYEEQPVGVGTIGKFMREI